MGKAEETYMVDENIRWHKQGGRNPKNKSLIVFKFQTARSPWDVGSTQADPYHDGSVRSEIRLLSDPKLSRVLLRERLQLAD